MTAPTAAILLIGNELLSGKIQDTNAYFLARELNALGIALKRVLLVPDEADDIVASVRELTQRFDMLFTSGGIGPTHDDITVEAVARALHRELVLDPALEARAQTIWGDHLDQAQLKMARIPRDCELIESEELKWPVLKVERVYVLAGVPQIFRRGFRAVRDALPTSQRTRLASAYLSIDEWSLAPLLDATIAEHPRVEVGSYPVMQNPDYRVRVTLEATDPGQVRAALQDLLGRVHQKYVVEVVDDDLISDE